MLPDRRHVLFTSFRSPAGRSRIEVYSLETGRRTVLVDGGFYGRYATRGHVLFARSTTVMAVRVDSNRLATIGQPLPVLAGVAVNLAAGLAHWSVSDTGTLAYLTQAAVASPRQLVWLDRSGQRIADRRCAPAVRGPEDLARRPTRLRSRSAMRTTPTFGPMTCRAVRSVASRPRRQRSSARSGRLTAVVCSSCSRSRSFISTRTLSMALLHEPTRVLDGPFGPDSARRCHPNGECLDLSAERSDNLKGGHLGCWDLKNGVDVPNADRYAGRRARRGVVA